MTPSTATATDSLLDPVPGSCDLGAGGLGDLVVGGRARCGRWSSSRWRGRVRRRPPGMFWRPRRRRRRRRPRSRWRSRSLVWLERIDLAVGIELLFLDGHPGQVEVGGDLDARLAGPTHALDQSLTVLADALPRPRLAAVRRLGRPGRRRRRPTRVLPCWSTTVTRSGFRFGTEPATRFWTARTRSADRLAAADADGDGGGGRLGLFLEQLALGQHQVDAGGGDAVDRADGARQLALQGALAVQAAGRSRSGPGPRRCRRSRSRPSPEVTRPLPDSIRRRGGDLVAGDHDGRAVALGLVLDAGLVEGGGDRRRLPCRSRFESSRP